MKRILFIFTILTASAAMATVPADSKTCGSPIGRITLGASAEASYILPTNNYLRSNCAFVAPDVRLGFSFSESTRYGRLYKDVTQGIGVNWNAQLPHNTLGNPAGVFLFQSATFYKHEQLSLEAGWNFGATMPWRQYDFITNPSNTVIGSRVNAMLGVNLSAVYRLNNRVALKAAITANHYSNGNTALPNAGVNTIGLQVGAICTLRQDAPETHQTTPLPDDFSPGMGYDVTIYGAGRKRTVKDSSDMYVVAPGTFGVAGINFAPMYAFNRYLRAGVSLDVQYDESGNLDRHLVDGTYGDDVRFYRQPFTECLSGGLSLRGEITLPIFSINAGIGYNALAHGNLRGLYQVLILKAYVYGGAFLQVGYRLQDFHEPNNLMLGVGFTFGRR